MCHELLRSSRFFTALLELDREIAQEARTKKCRHCGGRLDSAPYPRKPRGGPQSLGPEYRMRFSFSCRTDGCRKRATPPSVRYLGPRIYFGAVVVLVSALVHGLTEKRLAELREQISPTLSARTIRRWCAWWRTTFVKSAFFRAVRGRYVPAIDQAGLPASLLERFSGSDREKLISALEFLSPLSTRSSMAA